MGHEPDSKESVSDEGLVARARAGDPEAFGELVVRHREAVQRTALAALGGRADAEDVTQEAFVAAYRRLPTFRGEASFRTWLLRIAWRRALSRRRTAWLRRVASSEALREAGWEPRDPAPALEETVARRELVDRVARLLRALPTRLRDPLLLQASGDHTGEEIATLLGIPEGTLKWRVFEARHRLRERLARLGYADE